MAYCEKILKMQTLSTLTFWALQACRLPSYGVIAPLEIGQRRCLMSEKTRILIAYDGSNCADAALDDLKRAGLPDEATVVAMSVAELWFPTATAASYEMTGRTLVVPIVSTREPSPRADGQSEAMTLAQQAVDRIKINFPKWDVSGEACLGSPATQILHKAEQWKPDLIVVGSHGRSAVGRLFLGSVSQRIAIGSPCSVRIGRGRVETEDSKVRILIAADGMPDSEAAIKEVSARIWTSGSQVRLVTAIGPFYTGIEAPQERAIAENVQFKAAGELELSGLEVSYLIKEGDPRRLIVDEAERWGADTIFVGSSGMTRFERMVLGSVSAAVCARAHCTVEVVRGNREEPKISNKRHLN